MTFSWSVWARISSVFLLLALRPLLTKAEENDTTIQTVQTITDDGPHLRTVPCGKPGDCNHVDGTYCDADVGLCLCKPDYPVTDSSHCYKESKYDDFCQLDIQCQKHDKNTKCNRDFNLCECQPQYVVQSFNNGQSWCVRPSGSQTDMGVGSYVDPTLFAIMGALILMFIVLCVVLQLFAKARFQENRSIFNTANPRLMNVSLMKDTKSASQARSKKQRKSMRNTSMIPSDHGSTLTNTAGNDEAASVVASATAVASNPSRKRSQALALKGGRATPSSSTMAATSASNGNEDKILIEMKDSTA
eukprot:13290.XXX_944445_942219_1 [CDS] Oithona nana genome sequencing.